MSTFFNPITAVWEITMGCNMRCKHCGSSCESALEGELTTEEALKLCDDMKKLGFQWITLSGGEPTTRKDWDVIARRLSDNGIIPNMISNGWLIDEKIAMRAIEAGINTVAISIDGLKKTHDHIRKEGSYDKVMKALDILTSTGLNCSVITTINSLNIHELDELHDILSKKNLFGWQLQIGLPMGNMAQNSDLISNPEHIDTVIDFAYRASKKGGIDIQLADCIGYFNQKEIEVRKNSANGAEDYNWVGCGCGKYNLGILHDGGIVGCTSIRDKSFIEGNVRERSIIDIWNDPKSFSWNRELTKNKLDGLCKKCAHGDQCLGGCANTRLTMNKSVYGENEYCSYNVAVKKAQDQLSKIDDIEIMKQKARLFIDNNSYQLAEIMLSKLIEVEKSNIEAQALYGFVSFMLGNYADAKNANEVILSQTPNDPYALKGYGLSIARLGEIEEGIAYLKKSIENADREFTDPYFDLAVIYYENNRCDEAIDILEKGREISSSFREESDEFYTSILSERQ